MMRMGLRTLRVPPQLLIYRAAVQFLNQYDELVEGSLGPGVKLAGYHLQVIGVSPAHQRKGAAGALMSYAQAKVRTTLAGHGRSTHIMASPVGPRGEGSDALGDCGRYERASRFYVLTRCVSVLTCS